MTTREKQKVSDAYVKLYQEYLDFMNTLSGKKFKGENIDRYMGAFHAMEYKLQGMAILCGELDFDPINDI